MLTLIYEYPSSGYHFENNFQDKISPSEKSLEKPEEELISFKEEHRDSLRKSSPQSIQNEVLTLTSEHPNNEDHFESKFQDKFFHLKKVLTN